LFTVATNFFLAVSSVGNLSSFDKALLPTEPIIPKLDLGRDVSSIIINIGSNLDPIVPLNPCSVAIALEPVVASQIPPHPGLFVVPAAVTGNSPVNLAPIHLYNKDGVSSSLNTPAKEAFWNKNKLRDGNILLVPTLSFSSLLQSFSSYPIDFVLTDMQGLDFEAVSSAGNLLLAVKRLKTEVNKDQVRTYTGPRNDFCKDWLPYMTQLGYIFECLITGGEVPVEGYMSQQEALESCEKDRAKIGIGLSEYDALWRLSTEEPGLEAYKYPTHSKRKAGPTFSSEEYAKCG
jgi:hypothetical protein